MLNSFGKDGKFTKHCFIDTTKGSIDYYIRAEGQVQYLWSSSKSHTLEMLLHAPNGLKVVIC